jgi:hypothetical protein
MKNTNLQLISKVRKIILRLPIKSQVKLEQVIKDIIKYVN